MKNSESNFTFILLLLAITGFIASCKKELEQISNKDDSLTSTDSITTQQPFTALINVIEDNTKATNSIVSNSGYHTVYSLSINAKPGDIFRIRGQVEMTNDTKMFCDKFDSKTVRGNIRILVNGSAKGTYSSQNNVADNPTSAYSHHMHHMPLWSDAIYNVTTTGYSNIEIQYSVTKTGSSPAVKIEPFCPTSTSPYGHLIVEHYRTFSSRQAAKDSGALGLHSLIVDKSRNATQYLTPTTVYSINCSVKNGDIVRLTGQATSKYINKKAFHGQKIKRNTTRISPFSTENNIYRIPYLPLWTDAIDKPTSSTSNNYMLELHSFVDPDFGAANIDNAGYLYCQLFRKLSLSSTAKQLLKTSSINGTPSNYSLPSNSGWHNLITYTSQANAGDILKISGYIQLSLPNSFQDGVNCQLRLKVNGETVQCGKYITELSEVLPLRTEIMKAIGTSGNYTIELEALCSRYNANPILTVIGGQTKLLIDHFGD